MIIIIQVRARLKITKLKHFFLTQIDFMKLLIFFLFNSHPHYFEHRGIQRNYFKSPRDFLYDSIK